MGELKCPTCGKIIMSIKEVERILSKTFNKVLLSRCLCGESFEIRSPTRRVFDISTSSGKRLKQFIEEVEEAL
ncbi:MAG: hypothetical protein HXY44_03135 [Syntrophaceae bacterium]|nr:hypothetical protein [Syntrophaceae bacterium]